MRARTKSNLVKQIGIIIFINISLLTACNPTGYPKNLSQGVNRAGVSITFPIDGSHFHVGDLIDVQSTISTPSGVTAANLLVNDQLERDDPFNTVEGGTLHQPWTPPTPGIYILKVVLEAGGGGVQISNPVTIYVDEVLTIPTKETIPTDTPIPSETPLQTITPTWTVTIALPSITPTQDTPMATGKEDLNCRFGPGTIYEPRGYLMTGETVPIVGRNKDSSWWVVELPDTHFQCWVWDGGVTVTCNLEGILVFTIPPTPTVKPTNTIPPKYKACHDYPDIATCNNDPNSFGGCSWNTGLNKCQP